MYVSSTLELTLSWIIEGGRKNLAHREDVASLVERDDIELTVTPCDPNVRKAALSPFVSGLEKPWI